MDCACTIVVDAATRPKGSGNLFTYLGRVDLERFEDEDVNRLLGQYEPGNEIVVILLKPYERMSSYQVQPLDSRNSPASTDT